MPQIGKKNNSPLTALAKQTPELFTIPKLGDVLDAILIEKAPRAAYFVLGHIGTGTVYGTEFLNAKDVLKNLNPGDTISAKITDLENDDGYIELSLTEASQQKVWQELKELREKDEPLKVTMSGANSGGLLTTLNGVKAFIPVSQLSNEHYPHVEGNRAMIAEELKKLIGEELAVKIIDLNPRTNKLILSERAASEQSVKELLAAYSVGQIIDGTVSGVADFGAFIRFTDNPAIEGLIHVSELTHRLIDNPKEVVKIGDVVKAKIVEIKEGRVSLSRKALLTDPWTNVEEKYKSGITAKGNVAKFNPFGAFVNLDSEIQGIIHVSEFGSVEEMKSRLEIGKQYQFLIDSVKPQEKRITLKLKI